MGRYKLAPLPAGSARAWDRVIYKNTQNFIYCMRSRSTPRCDVKTASLAAVNAHLGNIALRTGDALDWDADKSQFTANQAANGYLKPEYRSPWRFPAA